jgi:hypothetical protein
MLNRFAPDPGGQQILFMHNDPRAATPGNVSYQQENYGRYDAIDTPISLLTLGHFGLGNVSAQRSHVSAASRSGHPACLPTQGGSGWEARRQTVGR